MLSAMPQPSKKQPDQAQDIVPSNVQPVESRKDIFMREFRCVGCRGLLAMEYLYKGRLVIKCPKTDCGRYNELILE